MNGKYIDKCPKKDISIILKKDLVSHLTTKYFQVILSTHIFWFDTCYCDIHNPMLIVIAVLILIPRMHQLRKHACLHIMHCIALSVCCIHFVRSSKTINLLQEGGILFVSILLGCCIQLRQFVKHPQENIFPPFKPADGIEDFHSLLEFINLTYHIFPFIISLFYKLVRHREI